MRALARRCYLRGGARTIDRQPAAVKPVKSAEPEKPKDTPIPIDQTDRNEVMAVVRDVFAAGGARDREEAIRDIARALGYGRVGGRIEETLDNDIRTAVRRGILENTPEGLRLLCRDITQYQREFLIEQLLAGMGSTWWEREQLIDGTARFLGFRRTGPVIRDTLKSAINGAIRRGMLEHEGTRVRRTK